MAIGDISKALWFRAKDLGTGSVTSWADQSGYGRNASCSAMTVATGSTPLGGKSVTGSVMAASVPTLGMIDGTYVHVTAPATSVFVPANLTDGDASTLWSAPASGLPITVTYRIRTGADATTYTTATVTEYTIRNGGTAANSPTAWTFQGSNDGSSWTTLDTVTGAAATANTSTAHSFSNSTAYEYYKWVITAVNGGSQAEWLMATLTGISTGKTQLDGELWVVIKRDTANSTAWRLGTSGSSSHYDFSGTVYDDTGMTTRQSFTPGVAITSWRIYRVRVQGGNWTAYLDGTQQTTTGSLAKSWQTSAPAVFVGLSGWVAEWILFDHALDSGEVTTVNAYLDAEHFTAATDFDGTASRTGTGSITAAGVVDRSTGATLSGTGTLAAAGSTVSGTTSGATLSGTGAVTAAGAISTSSGAALSGTGTIVTTAAGVVTGTATRTGTGTITAAGSVTRTLGPWEAGASGEALLYLTPEAGVLEVTYPATVPPAAITEVVNLAWQSHETATVGGDTEGMMSVPLGVPHVWVDGVDVTYFRDVATKIAGWRQESPFGWTSTTLTFPQVFHYEETGTGDLAWLYPDAPVEVAIVKPNGDHLHRFTGHLTSDDPGTGRGRTESVWGVEGALWQADHAHHPVPPRLDPTDIGTLVPDELNGTPSRRFSPIAHVSTGIPTRQRGSHGQTRWQWTADQLSTALNDAGGQWTIDPTGPRSFAMVLKDTTTVHWTITAGAPGVELDLSNDHHERIDAVYGRGVGPDGYAWANLFFPDLLPYDPPDYPYSDPDQNVLLGDTDADTLTGTGISDWQRRIRDLGYTSLAVDGVINSADIDAVRWIQRRMGIQVDGYLGPQTWAATWNVGAVGGDLRTIRLPLAVRPEVEQFIYAANGAIVGTNPDYDPSIIRHEVDIDFGAGVRKEGSEGGRILAQKILERGLDPGIVGTIKLTTCPWEGSRWEIDAGDNVLLKGYRGEDVLMRVTALDADPESLTVTLTVDSEFRDAMAVVQILNRNRESKADPARRPGNPNRRSRQDQDQVTPFEGESPAGRFPRMAIFEGLWTVWPVPVSEIGIVAKLRFTTSGPASKFAMSIWGRPITANEIAAKVPDPLAVSNPWDVGDTWLDDHAFIDGWGEQGQAAGYGLLGSESEGSPVTGKLIDDAGFPYVSAIPPWVWVAVYSPTSCYIEGRLYPDPVQ